MKRNTRDLTVATLTLLLGGVRIMAAEVPVTLYGQELIPNVIAINAGDSVTWTVKAGTPTNAITEIDGLWSSPELMIGETFSRSFSVPGLSAYKISQTGLLNPMVGTIKVLPWTNHPPAVTINSPVDGMCFPGSLIGVTVSCEFPVTNLSRIDLFSDGSLIGTMTAAPFRLGWTNSLLGRHVLIATAVDQQGNTNSSQPVSITVVGVLARLSMPQVLADGRLLFYFSSHFDFYIGHSDNAPLLNTRWWPYSFLGSGAFVTEPLTNVAERFYYADVSELPPTFP